MRISLYLKAVMPYIITVVARLRIRLKAVRNPGDRAAPRPGSTLRILRFPSLHKTRRIRRDNSAGKRTLWLWPAEVREGWVLRGYLEPRGGPEGANSGSPDTVEAIGGDPMRISLYLKAVMPYIITVVARLRIRLGGKEPRRPGRT
jgi:hypothetical protein